MIRLRRQEKYSVKLFDLIRKADTDKDAAFELGMLYLNGNNICQDTQRALFYFQQASELGHLGVEVIYAYLYKCFFSLLSIIACRLHLLQTAPTEPGSLSCRKFAKEWVFQWSR